MESGQQVELTAEELKALADEYFNERRATVQAEYFGKPLTDEYDRPVMIDVWIKKPTVAGLADKWDISRNTLAEWCLRKDDRGKVARWAKRQIEVCLEEGLYGKATSGIEFNLKNNFGYKDSMELELGEETRATEAASTISLAAKMALICEASERARKCLDANNISTEDQNGED